MLKRRISGPRCESLENDTSQQYRSHAGQIPVQQRNRIMKIPELGNTRYSDSEARDKDVESEAGGGRLC